MITRNFYLKTSKLGGFLCFVKYLLTIFLHKGKTFKRAGTKKYD